MTRVTTFPDAADRLLNEPGVERLVAGGARAVARNAGRIAPEGGTSRGLAESYKTTPVEETARGVEATAYTTDIAGHLAEWGSVNNPAYAPLRRGAEAAGFRTRPAPKGAQ